MKILTIVGARPQFIKAAMVSREASKHSDIEEVIVHTGQHFDERMSGVFFDEMGIPVPKYNLAVHGLSHGAMTGQMLEKIERTIVDERPEWVLVYGDTNSTLAGALAAAKLHVKVAHVEAGLRSFNMRMPEEINRILTDRVSSLLMCPTDLACDNLKREGFSGFDCTVVKTGDVVQDAAMHFSRLSPSSREVAAIIAPGCRPFTLVTVHRAENTDDPDRLKDIITALNRISINHRVILPLHPRTRRRLSELKCRTDFDLLDPVGYVDMLQLVKNSSLVMTDSGGLQKEAYFFGKHCVTLRDETEWVELVEGGYNVLAGTEVMRILSAHGEMLDRKSDFSIDLYGGGKASARVVESLLCYQD